MQDANKLKMYNAETNERNKDRCQEVSLKSEKTIKILDSVIKRSSNPGYN
jgi:hypothetical protein